MTTGLRPSFRFIATVILLALIGALDEWHQTSTLGRQGGDPFDWLADVAGSTFGAAFSTTLYRKIIQAPAPDDLAPLR